MNSDQHPALSTENETLPVLRLVLPAQLNKDHVLNGLVQAIVQARTDLAERACLFQHRVYECAARGDTLGQAFCRGQVLGGEHAGTAIDEQIIGRFDLWDQYPGAIPPAARAVGNDARSSKPRPATTSTTPAKARPLLSPDSSPITPGQRLSHRGSLPLGMARLDAAIMAVAWQAAEGWLPARVVHDRLDYPRPVAYSTLSSAMASLHRQGMLARRRGPARRWEYQAGCSPDEHLGELIADLLDTCASPQAALAHALRRPVRANSTATEAH